MDRLRQLIDEINTRLRVLDVSQRIAIALCGAMVAISLLWLLQWSTEPELVALIKKEFTFAELDAAEETLEANGIAHNVRGSRVFVRSGDRHNALRLLYKAEALPDGSLYDMATIVAEQNPFQAPEARQYAQTYAKGNELAKIIATSPFVKQASVLINPRTKRRLGGVSDVPTASVAIALTRGQEMTDAMVDGFAKLVSGAVAGLKPHSIFITDTATGRSYSIPHPDDVGSFDVFDMEKKREAHLQSKIMGTLAYIPGLQVAVTVEVDTSKRVTQRIKHNAAQTKVESSQTIEQGSQSAAAEPGVQANLGQAVTGSGAGQTSLTEETTTEYFDPTLSETETIEQIPFAIKRVTADVGIPRSFIVGVFAARNSDAGDPKDDDAEFVKLRDEQIARVKSSVERIVMARDPDDVQVDVYPDMEWNAEGGVWSRAPAGVGLARAGTDAFDIFSLFREYGPQAGLAVLAVFALLTMRKIVRNVPVPPPLAEPNIAEHADRAGDEPILVGGPQPVGKATVSESLLVAREVDDETLRYQELGEEVAKLVEADPEGAAELIRRWMEDV